MEDRRPIPGYEGLYTITRDGEVYSDPRPKGVRLGGSRRLAEFKRTVSRNAKGYGVLQLWRGGKYDNWLVHRLVALAFIPNPDGLPEVNHRDGDKTNNAVENLEWASRKENVDHARRSGLCPRGESHAGAKLTEEAVRDARRRRRAGEPYRRIAADHGVHLCTIRAAVTGKTWAHVDAAPGGEDASGGPVTPKDSRQAGTRPPQSRASVERPGRAPHAHAQRQAQ